MFTKFQHDRFGECDLVRIEGVDWIIRCCDSGQIYRVPLSQRHDFIPIDASRPSSSPATHMVPELEKHSEAAPTTGPRVVFNSEAVKHLLRAIRNGNRPAELIHRQAMSEDQSPPASSPVGFRDTPSTHGVIESPTSPAVLPSYGQETTPAAHSSEIKALVVPTDDVSESEKRRLRRVFESLRNGLSPIHIDSRPFAVGIEDVQQKIENLLRDVATKGGRAVVLRGAYGQGKTYCLQLLRQCALEEGFLVAGTEVDGFENQIQKPHFIYRSLMRSLSFPEGGIEGAQGLVLRTQEKVKQTLDSTTNEHRLAIQVRELFNKEIQCRPLAWLLSGVMSKIKPELVGLLAAEPGTNLAAARRAHLLGGVPRDWPAFSSNTQGDFGSYLLSGIGRLARFLGYQGLIVILDEMEKWQELNWNAQCRAGNLLGGLIWGATAANGFRECRRLFRKCAHSEMLFHSGLCGGHPFSTEDRCSLGVAIAMTPRGDDGPEQLWKGYGHLEIADLPAFGPTLLTKYLQRVFPSYCHAYGVRSATPNGLDEKALWLWRQRGDGSTRTAVQAVVSALDEWQQSLNLQEV